MSSFLKFLTHYADELAGIKNVLATVTTLLPIGAGDREHIQSVLDGLETAVASISDHVANAPADAADVVVKESDIERAVVAVLPGLLEKAVADYLTAHQTQAALGGISTTGNAPQDGAAGPNEQQGGSNG